MIKNNSNPMKIPSLLSFLIIFTLVGMSSCDQFSANKSDTPDSLAAQRIRDTTIIVKDSIINARAFDTIPLGFYQGMRFHIDTNGFRRWGSDYHTATSPCVALEQKT